MELVNILVYTQAISVLIMVYFAFSRYVYKSQYEDRVRKVKSLEAYLEEAKLFREKYRTLWHESVAASLSTSATKSNPKQPNYVSSPTQSVKSTTYARSSHRDDSSDDSFMNAVFIQAAMNNTQNDTYCAPSYNPPSYDSGSSSSSYSYSSSSSDSSSSSSDSGSSSSDSGSSGGCD